jgi:hypothetical protein
VHDQKMRTPLLLQSQVVAEWRTIHRDSEPLSYNAVRAFRTVYCAARTPIPLPLELRRTTSNAPKSMAHRVHYLRCSRETTDAQTGHRRGVGYTTPVPLPNAHFTN